MIQLRHVSKRFGGGPPAVSDLSLHVEQGQTLVLLGSSGCGKTTSLKMINRLIEPDEGTILVGGRDVRQHDALALRRGIGYVFQGIGLFPHMRVRENVEVVPRLLGWPRSRRRRRADELLDLVELPPAQFAQRYPDELSGGQQQRVGVARALAADPPCLLMDEPFGALDALTREALQQHLIRLKARLAKTVVFVTHDLFEALVLADQIAVMHAGRLLQVGTPRELAEAPADEFVRDLFGRPARQLRAFMETSAMAEQVS